MIYFALPDFYEKFYVNNFLVILTQDYLDYFQKEVRFTRFTGNFPYCYWTGNVNRNYRNQTPNYNDFIFCSTQSKAPLSFDFSNVFLEEIDFKNVMGNLILSTNQNGANYIEISDLNFYEYIEKLYPNYKFILSKNIDLKNPLTLEALNKFLKFDIFKLISLPISLINEEILKEIPQKSSIEITINPICSLRCKTYATCQLKEHKSIYDYNEKSILLNCPKVNIRQKDLSITEIDRYTSLGYSNFTFDSHFNWSNEEVIHFYLNYFLKPEYVSKGLKMWQNYYDEVFYGKH